MSIATSLRACLAIDAATPAVTLRFLFDSARVLHTSLLDASEENVISSALSTMVWGDLFALTVNEENSAGGRMALALLRCGVLLAGAPCMN
jgi:L-serine deaminase